MTSTVSNHDSEMEARILQRESRKAAETLQHRRVYAIGQMVVEVFKDIPKFVKTSDGKWVINIIPFEKYIKFVSDNSSIHDFISSDAPQTLVDKLTKDLQELNQYNFNDDIDIPNGVITTEDQITMYTDDRHHMQRRKYLAGMIILHYFPELPPLTGGTNDEYRRGLIQFKQLLKLMYNTKTK